METADGFTDVRGQREGLGDAWAAHEGPDGEVREEGVLGQVGDREDSRGRVGGRGGGGYHVRHLQVSDAARHVWTGEEMRGTVTSLTAGLKLAITVFSRVSAHLRVSAHPPFLMIL